jgi:hypothetical protein
MKRKLCREGRLHILQLDASARSPWPRRILPYGAVSTPIVDRHVRIEARLRLNNRIFNETDLS